MLSVKEIAARCADVEDGVRAARDWLGAAGPWARRLGAGLLCHRAVHGGLALCAVPKAAEDPLVGVPVLVLYALLVWLKH